MRYIGKIHFNPKAAILATDLVFNQHSGTRNFLMALFLFSIPITLSLYIVNVLK